MLSIQTNETGKTWLECDVCGLECSMEETTCESCDTVAKVVEFLRGRKQSGILLSRDYVRGVIDVFDTNGVVAWQVDHYYNHGRSLPFVELKELIGLANG